MDNFRIRLENKTSKEILFIYVDLYNERNGLMNFPVDLEVFEVLNIDKYVYRKGFKNNFGQKQETKLYENDVISFKCNFSKKILKGKIIWDKDKLTYMIIIFEEKHNNMCIVDKIPLSEVTSIEFEKTIYE